MRHSNIPMRNNDAKAIKEVRKILRRDISEPSFCEESSMPTSSFRAKIGFVLFILGAVLIGSCQVVHAFTDEQYVNAIYIAEGGLNARYPYGIRSVQCSNQQECRSVCLRTVRNNIKRFETSELKHHEQYLQFLANIYCPTRGRNLTARERSINRYWVKNVSYFLTKGV